MTTPNHSAQPSLALMMCVHDEAPFLRANLAYHHAVGVRRAYIFLDNCSDGSGEIVRSFPWAEAIDRPRPPETRFMRQHQNACAAIALERARREGYEWLLHLDADELAFGGEPMHADPDAPRPSGLAKLLDRFTGRARKEALARADLLSMLAGVKPETAMVHLPTHEAIPLHLEPTDQFWRNPYFQSGAPLVQKMLNPVSGKKEKFDRYLGHDQGKSIVRTSADVQAYNPHRWTAQQGVEPPDFPEDTAIPTETRGCHFHHLIVNPAQWLKKYAQFDGLAMSWPSGVPLHFPKGPWREAASQMDEGEAATYLDEWVFRDRETLDAMARSGEIDIEPDVATIVGGL